MLLKVAENWALWVGWREGGFRTVAATAACDGVAAWDGQLRAAARKLGNLNEIM